MEHAMSWFSRFITKFPKCLDVVQNIVFHIQSETKFMKWHFNQRTCQMNKIFYIKGEGMTSVLVLKVSVVDYFK